MVSLYQASIPVLIHYLENMRLILVKAEDHFATNGANAEEMIKFRLYGDMRGLDYQIQSPCNTAKFLAHRVAGQPDVFYPDQETTFPELIALVDRTLGIVRAIPEDSMNGKEDTEIVMETKTMGSYKFTGYSYVLLYALPNFQFHMSTAYCILRHLGVPLTAFDYLDGHKTLFKKIEA
ncbi:hypothetical protein ACHAQA_003669 [Verticillium albo-atrum]